MYCCIECKTIRFLIFPYGDESYIICSACYRIKIEALENLLK